MFISTINFPKYGPMMKLLKTTPTKKDFQV